MSNKLVLLFSIFFVLGTTASAEPPNAVFCQYYVANQLLGPPGLLLQHGQSAYLLHHRHQNQDLFFAATLECPGLCLPGTPFTKLGAQISRNGQPIAKTTTTLASGIDVILEAPDTNARIQCNSR